MVSHLQNKESQCKCLQTFMLRMLYYIIHLNLPVSQSSRKPILEKVD